MLKLLQFKSTTVEIILYYLTSRKSEHLNTIYNSRNYSILLNALYIRVSTESTTVEIILYYLTSEEKEDGKRSTTVEIILYYLTVIFSLQWSDLQQ